MINPLPKTSQIDYQIFQPQNVFTAIASGIISYGDLYQHVVELITDLDFKVGINAVYDFTQLTHITGSTEQWESVASGMADREIIPQPACTSIVVNSACDEVRTIMENYLSMTDSSLIDYKVFTEKQWRQAMQHVGLGRFADVEEFSAAIVDSSVDQTS